MDIKEYYRRMIGDLRNTPTPGRQEDAQRWYEAYTELKKDVRDMRNSLIKDSKKRLSVIDDIELIRRILRGRAVAHGGLGEISEECFQNFINDNSEDNVLSMLEDLIKEPNVKTARGLFFALRNCSEINSHKVKNNYLIVNRAVGACTEEVSSTSSKTAFHKVFNFFVREELIKPLNPDKKEDETQYWFVRNQHLMKELQEKFQTELKTRETDITLLSIFFWEFNEYRISGLPPDKRTRYDLPN